MRFVQFSAEILFFAAASECNLDPTHKIRPLVEGKLVWWNNNWEVSSWIQYWFILGFILYISVSQPFLIRSSLTSYWRYLVAHLASSIGITIQEIITIIGNPGISSRHPSVPRHLNWELVHYLNGLTLKFLKVFTSRTWK